MDFRQTKGPICGVENCRSTRYEEGDDGFFYCQHGHRQGDLVRAQDDEDNYTPGAKAITRKQKDDDEGTKATKHFSGRQAFDLYLKCLQLILRQQVWFLVREQSLPAELEAVVFDLWALRIAQLSDRIASDSQPQVFSTLDSEENDTTDDERGSFSTPKGRNIKLNSTPNLYDCLVLCYLGISTLRLPVSPGDIYAWVTDGKMVHRRAIKLLPLAMRDRLPPSYHAVLNPQTMLRHKRFYNTLTTLQISFEKDHGIMWPPINAPLLLFRYLKELALPLELYDATLRLGDLLGFDFAFHYYPSQQLGIRHLPEAQLIGCLIVCVKLFYPFDKTRRHPKLSSEPAATVVDWKKWCKEMAAVKVKQRDGNSGFTTEQLTRLQEDDIFSMQPDQLDQYLEFYADTFLDEAEIRRSENNDFRRALYGMFPIKSERQHPPVQLSDGIPQDLNLETIRAVHGSMKARAAIGDDEADLNTLRPGQMYAVWKNEKDLPKRANTFYEEAARLAGLSVDMLVMAVHLTEARVEKWRRKQREGTRARTHR